MNSYLNTGGRAVKVGALTLTAGFCGEMEPVDRCSAEEIPGVWTPSGEVYFSFNGRDYHQDFCAAWFYDGAEDYWDDENGLMCSDDENAPVTAAEADEIAKAAGGAGALYSGILKAERLAVKAAKADALRFLDQCLSEGEA